MSSIAERNGNGVKYVCDYCASSDIIQEGYIFWDIEKQQWDLNTFTDTGYWCNQCAEVTEPKEVSKWFESWWPECEGESLNEEGTRCWNCEPEEE